VIYLNSQLQKGSLCRTVASTDMNMVSSWSHAIFSVILKQTRIENLMGNKENDVLAKFIDIQSNFKISLCR